MKVLPLSEVKAKLSSLIDEAQDGGEEIVVTRNGRGVAVLMSMDAFEGWKETLEILSDTKTVKEIARNLRAPKRKLTRREAAKLFR